MTKAFVYTELQINVPFDQITWRELNSELREQPGFIDKTWLSGFGTNTVGGFYTFDDVVNAQRFATDYFPNEARKFGVAHTSRIFDADIVAEASREMNSVHFDGSTDCDIAAYVYTEVQLNIPFNMVPWREMNPILKQQPGLMTKTWLSGVAAQTPGGLYGFDSIENAKKFAIDYFPTEAKQLNAAFKTMVFDASVTKQASIEMQSPFYK